MRLKIFLKEMILPVFWVVIVAFIDDHPQQRKEGDYSTYSVSRPGKITRERHQHPFNGSPMSTNMDKLASGHVTVWEEN